jgi:membrane fusion protein (multidrug efflux system)
MLVLTALGLGGTGCSTDHPEGGHHEEVEHPIVVTIPSVMDVPTIDDYVSQVHSRRHVEVRALEEGYLQDVHIEEGQAVEEGDRLFQLLPTLYRAQREAERAELSLAEINLRNTQQLTDQGVVSDQELALATAERARARAEFDRASAEYDFTHIVAPFDGIVDRQLMQQGSLVEAGDVLTTISDNSVMWVYFNVPEADYLRFKAIPGASSPEAPQSLQLPGATVQLRLANGEVFNQNANSTITIESEFDSATGNIKFRADFPNPDALLRHGQTGTLLINETLPDALVIPQRATFEVLDRMFVYVVDEEGVAHQRQITVSHELEDIYVIDEGLAAGETFVLDGVRQIRDGQHLEDTEVRSPEEVLDDLKHHAE